MTHPGVEQIADQLAGVLSGDAAARTAAHLDTCASCAATADALRAIQRLLRAEGGDPAPAPAPDEVVARVERALAAETAARAEGGEVASLDRRRAEAGRRRRRQLVTGLLAAAAVTVVAVGVGSMVGQGGLSQQGAGGQAGSGESAVQRPAVGGPGSVAAAQLIERVAARHRTAPGATSPGERRLGAESPGPETLGPDATAARQRDRSGCVSRALGRDGWAGASYAVRLDGADGVVLLRPPAAPDEGLLIRCGTEPRVLLRRALDR